jgi:predicted Zn-dependent peptidase
MKKIVKLTESELKKVLKKIINESLLLESSADSLNRGQLESTYRKYNDLGSDGTFNEIFKNAIRKVTAEAKIALMSATTAEQKLIIMNALKNARTEAVAARDAALAALGALPTPPAELKKDEKKRN